MELIILALITFIIILVEIIAGAMFISKKKKSNIKEVDEEELKKNNLICRFVLDGTGKKIGESVAIDKDIMIIKTGSKYLGVPLKHVEQDEKTLLVKGLIDKTMAEEMGETWRKNSINEIKYHAEEIKNE